MRLRWVPSTGSDGAFITLVLLGMGACALLTSPARAQRVPGIDVSAWQGDISQPNWNRVYNEGGKRFAFIRVTHWDPVDADRGDPDWHYVNNFTRAKAAGLLVGPYHYAIWSRTPQVEADYFLQYALPYIRAGYLPPVLDLENKDNDPGFIVGATSVCDWGRQWIARVKEVTGVDALVYVSSAYTSSFGGCFSSPLPKLWVANYCRDASDEISCTAYPCNNILTTAQPPYHSGQIPPWPYNGWTFWQYCSNGSVPGIGGNCDLNVFNGTMEQLQALVIPGGVLTCSPATISATIRHRTSPANQSFTVRNTGEGAINYNISVAPGAGWLTVNPTSGSCTTETDTITVSCAASGLPVGVNSGIITVAADTPNSPQTVTVTITIQPVPADLNASGRVDSADVVVFRDCMTGPFGQIEPGCEDADFDHDNDVDQADFGLMQACLDDTTLLSDPYCIP